MFHRTASPQRCFRHCHRKPCFSSSHQSQAPKHWKGSAATSTLSAQALVSKYHFAKGSWAPRRNSRLHSSEQPLSLECLTAPARENTLVGDGDVRRGRGSQHEAPSGQMGYQRSEKANNGMTDHDPQKKANICKSIWVQVTE